MEAFCRHGYEATSLQDLLAAMGLSKSSLYQSFGDKQALYAACLERYCSDFMARLHHAVATSGTAFGAIERVLIAVADEAADLEPRGCLLHNSINEFGRRDDDIAHSIRDRLNHLRDRMAAVVRQAQAEHSIDPARSPEDLADFLIAGISGLRSMVKAGMDVERTRRIAAHLLAGL